MNKNIFKYDDWKRSEHMAVRECVGYYLFTHQLMEVSGPDACRFLDYICPNNIASLKVGRDRYTTILNEEGTIIDDVVVMRLEEEKYWVSTLYASNLDDFIYYHSDGYDIDFGEITEDWYGRLVPKAEGLLTGPVAAGFASPLTSATVLPVLIAARIACCSLAASALSLACLTASLS